MMRRAFLPLLAVALLCGCAATDPYRRAGMWQPDGANAGNIAAMLADPMDLVRGRDATGGERRLGAAAVQRLWDDRVKALQDPTSAGGGSGGGGGGAPGAAGGGGGAG